MQEKKKLKVTVCLMTYNQEKYIRQCLQSIVDQKAEFDYEVIVSDDCSTDDTKKIILEFAERYPLLVRPIFQKENIGAFANFIFLHDQASGTYVAHMDGDDYWLPGKLSYQVKILDQNPNIVQCWTCANLVDDDGNYKKIFPSRWARYFYPVKIDTRDIVLSYALVGHHSTQMYRRKVRRRELLAEKSLDYWVAFINSLSGDSFYSKKILSAYRMGKIESITRNSHKKRVTVDLLAEHLYRIAEFYPEYAVEAKANMLARRVASFVRGHDLTVIDSYISRLNKVPTNYWLKVKSLCYFILQKI